MRFQALSWESIDIKINKNQYEVIDFETYDSILETYHNPIIRTDQINVLSIRVCGRTLEREYVYNEYIGFRPYFYIHVNNLPIFVIEQIVEEITKQYRFRTTIKITLVNKIPFVGFHEYNEKFLRFDCMSKGIYKILKNYIKNELSNEIGITTPLLYESMCDPLVQFWIAYKIHPLTWIETDVNHSTQLINNVTFLPDLQNVAPFKVIHYDLECYSSVAYSCGKNQMPNPEIDEDIIIGVGAVITDTVSPTIHKKIYYGVGIDTNESENLYGFNTEEEMLRAFCNFLEIENVDIWNAFNNFGFDDKYLYTRLKKYDIEHYLMSRKDDLNIQLCSKNFSSNAFQFEAKYLHFPLVIYMDLLIFARREFKTELTKFSLENISQVLLKKGKHDVSPQEIFHAWATRSKTELKRVGEYCIQDCMLVAEIMDYKKVYSCILSRAELFLCDPRDLLLKGQQQIVFNLIYKQVRSQTNFCIPDSADDAIEYELDYYNPDDPDDSDDDSSVENVPRHKKEKFKGATVLEPKKGAYMAPIAGLDFASLYPSIMVAYNLCHSTKVITPESVTHITNPDHLYTTQLTGGRSTTFVQKDYRRGVLPQILLDLWKQRKVLKKDMARAKERGDVNMTAIYNAKQLAVKMAMNSIYGFCGADNGKLPMKDIAETVTSNGRMLIDRSKNYVESWYPCEVVYGDTDSVYVRFFLDELPEHLRDPTNEADRTEMLTWVMARSQEAADRITANYISPIELEFEKVMYPFILFKKKRYCCIIYEAGHPDKIDEVCTKGIAVTRRDFAPFVKRVYGTIIDKILLERDINGAFEYAESEMMLLLNGEYPIEELIVSRSISRKPESYANQNVPHLVLGKRIEERTGVPIKVGDRIQFVFIKGTGRQCDLVEEPHLVNQKQIDGMYYYEHQIHSSLTEMFSILDINRWLELDERLTRLGYQKQKNLQDISSFFNTSTSSNNTTTNNNSTTNNNKINNKKARLQQKTTTQKTLTSFFKKM